MYAHHFGLTQDPFSIAPDPRYLFMSERHREALAHLLYGVSGAQGVAGGAAGGFVLLTGDIGTGKTTICRCFLEQIPPGCHVAYIFNPKLTVNELLRSICEEFHIDLAPSSAAATVKDYIDALNTFLLQAHAARQSCLLIIDEAQNLDPDVLEQLRLLTNLETNERKLLQIVLIGQPELRAMLARPELEQLAQRVIARFHLDALTDSESTQYIEHRLAVAGHQGALPFDRRALKRIHRLARGVPRRINLLCARALLGAWASGLHRVDRAVVEKAAAEVFGSEKAHAPRAVAALTIWMLGGLVLLGGVALAVALGWPRQSKTLPPPQLAASSPQAGASAPAPIALPVARPVEEIEGLLPLLPRDINVAWRELLALWKLPSPEGDPCQGAAAQQLQCYQANKLNVPLLRQLGRPAILKLQAGNEAPVYVLLTGLGEQTATLSMSGRLHTVRLVSLGRLWRGDFATYWRPPSGYSPHLREGSRGEVIDLLTSQLDRIDGVPTPAGATTGRTLDAALMERVRTFQRAQGLKTDGLPGPMTFMQLESAAAGYEPRLQTESR